MQITSAGDAAWWPRFAIVLGEPGVTAFRENGVVEIESEWTARDRESKMFSGPARTFSTQVSVETTDVNPGHQAGSLSMGTQRPAAAIIRTPRGGARSASRRQFSRHR